MAAVNSENLKVWSISKARVLPLLYRIHFLVVVVYFPNKHFDFAVMCPGEEERTTNLNCINVYLTLLKIIQ